LSKLILKIFKYNLSKKLINKIEIIQINLTKKLNFYDKKLKGNMFILIFMELIQQKIKLDQ